MTELEPGDCYRVFFRQRPYTQLQRLLGVLEKQGIEHLEELKKVVASAEIRKRPTDHMTRKQRAEWVADEIFDVLGEVETLKEEMDDWTENQKGYPLQHTAQYSEVQDLSLQLKILIKDIEGIVERLRKLEFQSWESAGQAAKRRDELLRKHRARRPLR